MTDDERCTLDEVLITDELARRPSRPPDHAAEAGALGALAQTLATRPRTLLQQVVEAALALCRAESAGVSILVPGAPQDGEHGIFRWHATAGVYAPHADALMPSWASPCGEVVARDAVLLVDRPGRHFRAFAGVDPPIREGLLTPWPSGGVPAGTLWAVLHGPERHFDGEDARLLASLARFAAAAWQTVRALEAAEAGRAVAGVELRQAEAWYRTLVQTIDEGFCLLERVAAPPGAPPGTLPDFRYLATNPAFERHAGLSAVVGRTLREVVPAVEADVLACYDRVATTGEPARFELRVAALDRWIDARVTRVDAPGEERLAVVFTDVTEGKRAEAALRASEERYRHIVEGARDYAIFTLDPGGAIASWAPGAEAVFGWTATEAVGQPFAITFPPAERAAGAAEAELREAERAGVVADVRWHQRRDGTRVFVDGSLRALRDAAGALRGFLKVGHDVTRRWETDEALRASEARYRALVEHVAGHAIFLLDAAGGVTEWPASAARVTGYAAEEVVGRHLALFYPPEDVAANVPARHLAQAAAEGHGEWEGWRVRRDGTRFWANEILTAIRDGEGRLSGFTKISRDLTERRLAEQAAEQAQLAAARDELRRALAVAEEEERRRLARELHDQLGQHLTGFALGLADARRRLAAGEPAEARLVELEELARLMTRDARTLALDLRPPELDDVGLESALESYVREWSARTGVAAEVAVLGSVQRALPPEVGTTLYRITQEALTNVARHADAAAVSVILEAADDEVRLMVEDDGRGFDPQPVAARVRAERRLGLAGVRERAALLGGTLAVESSPGVGTTVLVRLPIDRPRPGGPGAPAGHA